MNNNIFFKWHSIQLLRRMRPSVDPAMESPQDILSEKSKMQTREQKVGGERRALLCLQLDKETLEAYVRNE